MKPKRWYELVTINLFWLGLNTRNNSITAIFLPFLVAAFARPEIKNTALGGIRTAGLVIAMLVQPAMGLLSDRSTSRFGRRRPFIFAGVLLDLVFLGMIAFASDFGMLLAAVLLVQFSSNISHGALQGLIPDLVPENQQATASGIKAVMELLPVIVAALLIAPLVGAGHFRAAVAVTGALLLAAMLLTLVLVKEKPLQEKPALPLGPPMLRVLGVLAGILGGAAAGLLGGGLAGLVVWQAAQLWAGDLAARAAGVAAGGLTAMALAVAVGVWAGCWSALGNAVRQNTSFVWWVVNRLLFLAAVTSLQMFTPFFLMYAFQISREQAAGMTGALMGVVGVCTMLATLPSGWLADRVGRRRLVGISGALAGGGAAVLLGCIWVPQLWLIYTAGCILGLATGLFTATSWALGCELAPPAEAGRYLGISNLAGAGAGMIGTGVGGPVADLLDAYAPGWGYFVLFASYSALFFLSILALRGVKEKYTGG